MKRVVHIWQSHYPWEIRVGKINRALQSSGVQVHVVARRRPAEPESEVVDSVSISRIGFEPFRVLSTPVPGNPLWKGGIEKAIGEFKPDVLLVRDLPLAVTAGKLGRRHKLPVFLDMAEPYPEAMRSGAKYSSNFVWRKLVHDWRVPDRVEAQAMTLMDGILVVCEEQKEKLVREYSYPAGRICVVLNTPEVEAWASVSKGTTLKIPFRFGYHGILSEDRELDVVLRGFDLACVREPEIRLLIAGGGAPEKPLRALAGGLVSRDKIAFTGRYSPEELGGLYSQVDFGIVSLRANTFTEHTLANKFFDYAVLGKPFIYPDLKPLRRVMARMNCGVPFEPGSPESAARAFREIRRANYGNLSRNGLDAINNEFNWRVDSTRMLEFLKRGCKSLGAG